MTKVESRTLNEMGETVSSRTIALTTGTRSGVVTFGGDHIGLVYEPSGDRPEALRLMLGEAKSHIGPREITIPVDQETKTGIVTIGDRAYYADLKISPRNIQE